MVVRVGIRSVGFVFPYFEERGVLVMAEHLGIEIPATKVVKDQMDWMYDHGMIDEDQCALAKYYENSMGVEIK